MNFHVASRGVTFNLGFLAGVGSGLNCSPENGINIWFLCNPGPGCAGNKITGDGQLIQPHFFLGKLDQAVSTHFRL